jgi:hypothetical protein
MIEYPVLTDYLYARPSFLSGVARLFDFFGLFTRYNFSRTEEEADAKALYADWRAVGSDLAQALRQFDADEQE